jgi:bifunctional N-acetylglucosamine-1-phosphate-uridyltransferase/glucosamine-1-phosphate-acetyltransferase GlmU-like protein
LIVGHKAEDVIVATENAYHYIVQKEQLGTGHAVLVGKSPILKIKNIKTIVVLCSAITLS